MATWDLRNTEHHILICNGSSCMKEGAEELTQAIRSEIQQRHLDERIHTTRTRCNGRCQDKCVVIAYPNGTWYKDMQVEHVPSFIDSLVSNSTCFTTVSHTYKNGVFTIEQGIPTGAQKKTELVQKVSK